MNSPETLPLDKERPANDADNLIALKSLLFGEEQQRLEQLSERLQDPERRSEDVAGVLPESLLLSGKRGNDLANALEQPVTACIQRSIERDPERFADAMYPAMGPAIRQSISATLKELVANINRTLDHSLSVRGLKWRFEAMRSGVPFAEVVLRHTLTYRVEQVFLIQNGSGLLMHHVHDELAISTDPDAVSGMLTAIAQFVRDAFHAGEQEGLETVEIGDHTVLLVHGPHAYLAAVVRGIAPRNLRTHCQKVMEEIHQRYQKSLAGFKGDPASLLNTRPLLESCLLSEQKAGAKRKGLAPPTTIVLLLLMLAALWGGFQWWSIWQEERDLLARQQRFIGTLQAQPGMLLTETQRDGHNLWIRGLRDPLAASPQTLLEKSDLRGETVELVFRPYLDASPAFAMARAQTLLAPPASVELQINERGDLSASGVAEANWIERAAMLAPAIPGVRSWSDDQLIERDQALLREARSRLTPPEGVRLSVNQGVLSLQGHAPLDWYSGLQQRIAQLQGLDGHRLELDLDEQLQFDALLAQLNGTRLMFLEGTTLGEDQLTQIGKLATRLQRLLGLASRLGHRLRVSLIGRADDIGGALINEKLALARALIVRDVLLQQGLPKDLFQAHAEVGFEIRLDPSLRHVEVRVSIAQSDGR